LPITGVVRQGAKEQGRRVRRITMIMFGVIVVDPAA